MAYEHMTYEFIMSRMMDRVISEYPNLDNREGSIVFNALAGAAMELAIAYENLRYVHNESFINTATRHNAIQLCDQMGMDITTFEATAGTFRGEFNVEVPLNSRWNCDIFNFTVTEALPSSNGYYAYKMQCETIGTDANNVVGILTPITDAPTGLNYAQLVECITEGESEKSTDEIRAAYADYVKSTLTDGNVAQYKLWANEYDGVGNVKVLPLWNGANTVKVSILSASNGVASEELVKEFQDYLDPGSEGMGNGKAPIGAAVTVTTATEVPITLTGTVSLANGYSDTTAIDKAINSYFASIAYEKSAVAYMSVGATILNVPGVEFLSDLKINGGTSDITLEQEQIPVFKSATWTVSE